MPSLVFAMTPVSLSNLSSWGNVRKVLEASCAQCLLISAYLQLCVFVCVCVCVCVCVKEIRGLYMLNSPHLD